MNDVTLRLGFAFYFVVPLALTFLWFDLSRGVLSRPPASRSRFLGGAALLSSLGGLLAMLAMLPLAWGVSLGGGHRPDAAELARYGLVALAVGFYALLHFGVVAIVSLAVRTERWVYFTLFLIFIFVYNWWMIYPLLSSFHAVGLERMQDPAGAQAWMGQVTDRIVPLYSAVPHYNYYIALTVTYLRRVLDPAWFLTSFLSLVSYAALFFVAALLFAREAPAAEARP